LINHLHSLGLQGWLDWFGSLGASKLINSHSTFKDGPGVPPGSWGEDYSRLKVPQLGDLPVQSPLPRFGGVSHLTLLAGPVGVFLGVPPSGFVWGGLRENTGLTPL